MRTSTSMHGFPIVGSSAFKFPTYDTGLEMSNELKFQKGETIAPMKGGSRMKFPYDPTIDTKNEKVFISVDSMLDKASHQASPNWSIFKVPNRLRKLKPDTYTPHLVSIGPIHHKKDSTLQAMERHKLGYMKSLLDRTQDPKETLTICTQAVLVLEDDARSCYADKAVDDEKSIAEILLVDGCFIIELLLKYRECPKKKDGPLLRNLWMASAFLRDLSLLENQIPFFVLETLFDITTTTTDQHPVEGLSTLAFHFFSASMPLNPKAFTRNIDKDIMHLLDLLHKCLEPEGKVTEVHQGYYKRPNEEDECLMRTIEELVDSGVEIKRSEAKDLVGIRFEEGMSAVLEIPELCVDDVTEMMLRNLLAYEQYLSPGGRHITSYALLMDRLISLEGDVKVLEKARVLKNSLGQYRRVADLFNDLCIEVVTTSEDEYMYSELCVKVDKYCSKWWPKNKAALRREYFSNIWRTVAFVIAFLLLVLTIEQAVYAALTYYN